MRAGSPSGSCSAEREVGPGVDNRCSDWILPCRRSSAQARARDSGLLRIVKLRRTSHSTLEQHAHALEVGSRVDVGAGLLDAIGNPYFEAIFQSAQLLQFLLLLEGGRLQRRQAQ